MPVARVGGDVLPVEGNVGNRTSGARSVRVEEVRKLEERVGLSSEIVHLGVGVEVEVHVEADLLEPLHVHGQQASLDVDLQRADGPQLVEETVDRPVIARGAGDDQVAVELLDLATLTAGRVPATLGVDDVLDDLDDLADQLVTGTTAGILALAGSAEDVVTVGLGLDVSERSAGLTGCGGDRGAEVEVRGVVEVGHLEKQVSDVVDDRDLALAKSVLGGDHHHAVLDAELGTVEVVTELLEHAAQGDFGGDRPRSSETSSSLRMPMVSRAFQSA